MRELLNEDMYLISEIADKTGLELPEINIEQQTELQQTEMGYKLMIMIIKKMYKAKPEINQLLQNVFEKTDEEMEKMKLKETIKLIKELFAKEGFLDFLS